MTTASHERGHYTAKEYLQLTHCGIVSPDDHVELLDGLIVSMAAQSAPHASAVYRVQRLLSDRLGKDFVVRGQMSFVVDEACVPEPDIAVVPGPADLYDEQHPTQASLIVEVAHSSVIQDRLTKAAIYARAGIPDYWIVNLRDHCVEVFRDPDCETSRYATVERAVGADQVTAASLPGLFCRAQDLLPRKPAGTEVG